MKHDAGHGLDYLDLGVATPFWAQARWSVTLLDYIHAQWILSCTGSRNLEVLVTMLML